MSEAADRVERLRTLGRLDAAEQAAREALAAEPGDPELLTALAVTLLNADRPAEGVAAAAAACAAAPDHERAHRILALLHSRLGRHDAALAAGYAAVELAPEEPYAALGYATVLQAAGRRGEALEVARRAVTLNPELPDAHLLVADICDELGQRKQARAAYREVLRLDPTHATARHDLAVTDLRSRRPGRALRGLIEAGTLDPTLTPVLDNVAAALWTVSWRLRMLLVVGTLATIGAAAGPDAAASLSAALVLASGGLLAWWTARGLPRHSGPILLAALRRDRALQATYLVLAGCAAIFIAILFGGVAGLALLVWLALIGLGLFSILVRMIRRDR